METKYKQGMILGWILSLEKKKAIRDIIGIFGTFEEWLYITQLHFINVEFYNFDYSTVFI